MSLMPCAAEHRGDQQAHGPGAGDEDAIVGTDVSQPQCVQGDRRRLRQRGRSRRQGIRDPDQAVGRHCLVLAEGPAVAGEVRRGAPQAHRRAAPAARPAGATPRGGGADHAVAGSPARVARRGSDNARPLVAEDGPGPGVPLQDHVQIRAADAAGGDLHQYLVGAGLRSWDLVELHPALAHIDSRRHQFRRHGGHTTDLFRPMPSRNGSERGDRGR